MFAIKCVSKLFPEGRFVTEELSSSVMTFHSEKAARTHASQRRKLFPDNEYEVVEYCPF